MKTKDLFLLTWKKFALIAVIFILFFFFRNLVNRFCGINQQIISFIYTMILIYFIICIVYSLDYLRNKPKKKRGKRGEFNFNNLFLLTWKKFSLIIIAWVAAVVIHNFGTALIGFEEPLFFILAVIIIPFYIIVSIVYSIIYFLINKRKIKLKKKK